MNPDTLAQRLRASVPLSIAAFTAVTLTAVAPSAQALGRYIETVRDQQILCELESVKGTFTSTGATYLATGQCVMLDSPQRIITKSGNKVSEFPDTNKSIEMFRATWTAQGSYNAVTKETWEKVTMPVPAIDQKTPPGRPYGTYETRMNCHTDPWLTGKFLICNRKTSHTAGNAGDLAAMLDTTKRPLSAPNKDTMLQALNESHDRYVRTQSFASTAEATSKGGAAAAMFAPTIVEPKPGSTHRPQTAMSMRVASAKNAKDTSYELQIQVQVQANFDWRTVTSIPVSAAVAQSGPGYRGWGAHVDGTGAQMTASVGTYRVRALATAPSRSVPGEWVEFKIAGTPGVTKDDLARSKLGTTNGARAAFGLPAKAAANEAPRVQTNTTPVIAPPPAALSATANKADAVSLSRQPPPPVAPMVLPNQAPSALR